MANINKFYDNKFIKYLLIFIVIFIIFMKTYYKNKKSIKEVQKDVLMYTREYDILESIENDAQKKETEKQKKADTHIYKSNIEKKAEQIERYRNARTAENRRKEVERKQKITDLANQEIRKQKEIINKKVANSNYKEINRKYYLALTEIKNTVKQNQHKNANKKIKRGDVVYATIKVDLNSNKYLKQFLTNANIPNDFYNGLAKNGISKTVINEMKKVNLKDPQDLLFKVGFKSNFYDQLIDKKVGDTLIVNYKDYLTNTQSRMLEEEKERHLRRIEIMKMYSTQEEIDLVKDIYDKLSYNYEVKILDIIDDNTKKKFDLNNVLEENFDKIDDEVKENLRYEQELKERIEKINLE